MTNRTVTVASSAARTTTGNSGALIAPTRKVGEYRGAVFTLDITAASGTTPTLDVKVQRFDVVSGQYVDLPSAAFAQKTATGTDDVTIYPGIAETANRSVSDVIGEVYRVVWTIGGTTPSFTFSIGAVFIP